MVEQQEFDRIFNKCYLAEEKVKDLQRELHKKEKISKCSGRKAQTERSSGAWILPNP